LDADDKMSPIVLEKAVAILDKNAHIGIVGGQTECFGARQGIFKLEKYSFPEILAGNQLVCSCVFRRSDWEKVGGYNPNMIYGWEDFDFWLSLIELGVGVYQFDDVFLYYRQHEVSMIKALKEERQKKMVQQILLNHPKLYRDHPRQKKQFIRRHSKYYDRMRRLVKVICVFVPVKSWRHKLRDLYRKG